MKKIIIVFVFFVSSVFCLFAEGEAEKKVDRESWKQSKVVVHYLSGTDNNVNVFLNGSNIGILQNGGKIEKNCPEGKNNIKITTQNDSKELEFTSEVNITFIQFNIISLPTESKVTLTFNKGKKNSSVNILLNGSMNTSLEVQQTKDIPLNEGKNDIVIKSGKYSETISVIADSNNLKINFDTSVTGRINNVVMGDTVKLVQYKIQNLKVTNTEIVQMPENIKKLIEEEEKLANLYRQAGNNFGNLRNTSRNYLNTKLYITATYNFGDGNYIFEQKTTSRNLLDQMILDRKETGTFRVSGNTVIFLSSEGVYSTGTITGTALTIGDRIYR